MDDDGPRFGVEERRWRAMGSDAQLLVVGGSAALADAAVARVAALEAAWSRFLDDSDVTVLNRAAGAPVVVSPATVLLVSMAIEAWRISGGAFEPLVLGAVEAAGYDRSFELLAERDHPDHTVPPAGWSLRPSCLDIRIDGASITLPAGSTFDPGGIGKGLAADLVATELIAGGARGACVNLGGDVRLVGEGPEGGGWTVAIAHPADAEALALVGLTDGAVATSSSVRRRWTVAGEPRHHLIDPDTGRPATTDVELASVIAGEAWRAEVLAKAMLLRGSMRAFDLLGVADAGMIVTTDRRVHVTASFARFGAPPRGAVLREAA